jgi:hypothetical protein
MPTIRPVEPPAPGTYGRVLRRYDRDPMLQIRFSAYDANIKAKPVEMFGRVAATLFFPPGRDAAALRATKVGWVDETDAWTAHVAGLPAPSRVKPSAPGEAKPEAPIEQTRPNAPSAVRDNPEGVEPVPGLAPVARKRAARA